MELIKEDLFTIEEVAKWCGISRNAAYMHYRRGHLSRREDIEAHRVYFTRQAVEEFKAKYLPTFIWQPTNDVH